jgi:hypothetical protein
MSDYTLLVKIRGSRQEYEAALERLEATIEEREIGEITATLLEGFDDLTLVVELPPDTLERELSACVARLQALLAEQGLAKVGRIEIAEEYDDEDVDDDDEDDDA